MNFSQFKKIGEDEHTATLMHPKGHQIKVAKSALSKPMQKQLSKLPMHMADGGEVQPAQQMTPELQQYYDNTLKTLPIGGISEEDRLNKAAEMTAQYRSAQEAKASAESDKILQDQLNQQKQAEMKKGALARYGMAPAVQQVNYNDSAPIDNSLQNIPMQQAPAQQPINPMMAGADAYLQNVQGGIGQQLAGMKQMADVQSNMANAQVDLLKRQQAEQEAERARFQEKLTNLDNSRKAAVEAFQKGHIKPQNIFSNMNVPQQILATVALAFGGGAQPFTGHNDALERLQKQVDRDMTAQEAELGKNKTLLEFNMQDFKNAYEGHAATRAQITDIYANMMEQQAKLASGEAAKAQYLQLAGALRHQSAAEIQQAAMRSAMMKNAAQGGAPQSEQQRAFTVTSLIPKEHQGEAMKQLTELTQKEVFRDKMLGAFDNYVKNNKISARVFSPIQSSQARATFGPYIAEAAKNGLGKFTEMENAIFGDASKPGILASNSTIEQKRQMINDVLSGEMHYPLLSMVGIGPKKVRPPITQLSGSSKFRSR